MFTVGDYNEFPTGVVNRIDEFKIGETNKMAFKSGNISVNISLAKKAPKKERITVTLEEMEDNRLPRGRGYKVLFSTSQPILMERFAIVRAAMEAAANDEPYVYGKEKREAEEKAFNAAREKINFLNLPRHKYTTFQDFINSKQNT